MITERQIIDRIEELKKEIQVLEYVLENPKKLTYSNNQNFGRPKGTYKYTKEEQNFLKECEDKGLDYKETTDLFNLKFKKKNSYKSRALYNFMLRTGIKKISRHSKKYTNKEDDFILKNTNNLSQFEIARQLNRTRDSIKNRINLLNIKKWRSE